MISGMVRNVQRKVYPSNSVPGRGIRWEWYCDVGWMAYDIPTSEVIEKQSLSSGSDVLDLINTPVAIPNVLNFHLMQQINKHTGFHRKVQRLTGQMYPSNAKPSNVVGASPKRGHVVSSTLNGHMFPGRTRAKTTATPGHTRAKTTATPGRTRAKTTATPKKGTKPSSNLKKMKKAKVEHAQGIDEFNPEIFKTVARRGCNPFSHMNLNIFHASHYILKDCCTENYLNMFKTDVERNVKK